MFTDADHYFQQGQAYAQAGQFDQALEAINEAICLNPENADCYMARARVHQQLGQFQAAIDDSYTAAGLQPKNADYLLQRGLIYEAQGNLRQAVNDFSRAIALNPALLQAYLQRSSSRAKLNNIAGALEDLQKAHQLDPTNMDIEDRLELLQMQMKSPSTSSSAPSRPVARKQPRNQQVFRSSERHYPVESYHETNWKAVWGTITLVISIVGFLLEQSSGDKPPEAAFDIRTVNAVGFTQFTRAANDRANAPLYSLTRTAVIRNNHLTATARYLETAAAYPTVPGATPVSGTAADYAERCRRSLTTQFAQAMEDCTYAIRLDPNFALAYYYRSLIQTQLNNVYSANLDIQKALELDPDLLDNPDLPRLPTETPD